MSAEREQMTDQDGADLPDRPETPGSSDDADAVRHETPADAPVGDAMAGMEPAAEGDAMAGMEPEGERLRDPLLPDERSRSYRERWERIQVRFVDEPQTSVEEADRLVVDVIQQLQSSFTAERETLEAQWQRGSEVETEQLRLALQRYRSFFDRLLAA